MRRVFPYVLFLFLMLLVMLPLYKPGYIFLLDMVWSPNMDLSDFTQNGIKNSFPITLIIIGLSKFLPVDLIQKFVLSLIVLLPGISMFHLAKKYMAEAWATIAGITFMINPYVYERLLAGQWYVLLGYSLFPLLVNLFINFLNKLSLKDFAKVTLILSIYPIINEHWAYISYFFLSLLGLIQIHLKRTSIRKLLPFAGVFIVVFFLINSFWIFNSISDNNQLTKITKADLEVYSTLSDPNFGPFVNVISLYGFWGGGEWSPKIGQNFWFIWPGIIFILSILGAIYGLKKRSPLAITLTLTFIPSVILSVGYANNLTAGLTNFLFDNLPGFKGLRDTAKLVGIIAFTYSFLFPLGANKIRDWFEINNFWFNKSYLFLIALFPLLMGSSIFWGLSNQVKPSSYPKSWEDANQILTSTSTKKVLFFPWHSYVAFPFSQGRIIANPARPFFDPEILSSSSIDNTLKKDEIISDLDQKVYQLISKKSSFENEANFFKSKKISHIVLSKVSDWEKYEFLESSNSLQKIYETGDLIVWRLSTTTQPDFLTKP